MLRLVFVHAFAVVDLRHLSGDGAGSLAEFDPEYHAPEHLNRVNHARVAHGKFKRLVRLDDLDRVPLGDALVRLQTPAIGELDVDFHDEAEPGVAA